jgi:hypothetical protein
MNPNFDAAQQALLKGSFFCILSSLVAVFLHSFLYYQPLTKMIRRSGSRFCPQTWPLATRVVTRCQCDANNGGTITMSELQQVVKRGVFGLYC